jgi:hypothetical protein
MRTINASVNVRGMTLAAAVSLLTACSSTPEQTDTLAAKLDDYACYFPASREEAPKWVCTGEIEGELTAVGSYEPSYAGYDYRMNMAALRARHQLAEKMSAVFKGSAREMRDNAGVGMAAAVDAYGERVASLLTSQTLRGTKIYSAITGPDETLFVLVGVDKKLAAEQLKEMSHSSFNQADARWQEEKGRKAMAEMDAAIDRQFGLSPRGG